MLLGAGSVLVSRTEDEDEKLDEKDEKDELFVQFFTQILDCASGPPPPQAVNATVEVNKIIFK